MKTHGSNRSALSLLSFAVALLINTTFTTSAATCVGYASSLAGWWKGDSNTLDQVMGIFGKISGNTTYKAGEVNQAFSFDGSGDSVNVGNGAALKLQNFTIEGWIKRDSKTLASVSIGGGVLFGWGSGGYAFGLQNNGHLFLSKVGGSQFNASGVTVTDTNIFHHVAVTKSNAWITFFVDGTAIAITNTAQTFTFATTAAIGARGDGVNSFLGRIDEVSLYNSPLDPSQILTIYQATSSGKCTRATLPIIISQPANAIIAQGGTAVFSVGAESPWPLTFQWTFNNTNLHNATNASLSIANAQLKDSGAYKVKVSNALGAVFSSDVFLSVVTPSGCIPPPASLVGWWSAEGTTHDNTGTNTGILHGDIVYTQGKINSAFLFDGDGDWIELGHPPELQLQNFTIEAWVKRNSLDSVSSSGGEGVIFGGDWGEFTFDLAPDGHLMIADVGSGLIESAGSITDTNVFHHVAVTKQNSTITFYIDGALAGLGNYDPVFDFEGPLAIGGNAYGNNSFNGAIDEIAIYNQPLDGQQVNALYEAGSTGKCAIPPRIIAQPTNQTGYIGDNLTLRIDATGGPLNFQWFKNGSPIIVGTNNVFALENVHLADAGSYTVKVIGAAGSLTSSSALISVQASTCTPATSGLISWWRGESNAWDEIGGNQGTVSGEISYVAAKDGLGFRFNGSDGIIELGRPDDLQLQNFSIEGWIKRNDAGLITGNGSAGLILSWGVDGFGFGLTPDGHLLISQIGRTEADSAATITNLDSFHHVAVTFTNQTATFYLDGQLVDSVDYGVTFTFDSDLSIGGLHGSGNSLIATVDELSIYSSILPGDEILRIYNARVDGKCVPDLSPVFLIQPTGGNALLESSFSFSTKLKGSPDFTYQWRQNGTNIPGATTSTLLLTNLQVSDAGSYSVVVTNRAGTATSSNAVLTLYDQPCIPINPGIVSWWRAEGTAQDEIHGNNGTLVGPVSFAPAMYGQGFALIQGDDYIDLGQPASLQLQNFSIEAWIKRSDPSQVSRDSGGGGVFSYGYGGYGFGLFDDGSLYLSKTGESAVSDTPGNMMISDTGHFHHIAVVKNGSAVTFYLDGVPGLDLNYNPRFSFAQNATIGAAVIGRNSFIGIIDELAIYTNALSASEIQNLALRRKCSSLTSPSVFVSPASLEVRAGTNAVFSASDLGATPLFYQWRYNNASLSGQTNSSLTLANVRLDQTGSYSVIVSNSFGVTTSSDAILIVDLGLVSIKALGTNGNSGSLVSVPILMTGNGNENAVAFSVNFDPAKLSFVDWTNTSPAPPSILVNTNLASGGKLGLAIGFSAGSAFTPGTNELIKMRFATAGLTNSSASTLSFGSNPSMEEVTDTNARPLPSVFTDALIGIAFVGFEGDVAPRTGGDARLSTADWVQVGRFAAQLDLPTNANEFQRADCAPRSTFGDGSVNAGDWVQAGRYAVGLDPATAIGGPTTQTNSLLGKSAFVPLSQNKSSSRQLSVSSTATYSGENFNLEIVLAAQGDENAAAFSLQFDPTKFRFISSSLGAGATGAISVVNSNNVFAGTIGFMIGLSPGQTFPSGNQQLASITLQCLIGTTNSANAVILSDQPIARFISDTVANPLTTSLVNGSVTIDPLPKLSAWKNDSNITLTWPLRATNFSLQTTTNFADWIEVADSAVTNGGSNLLTLPTSNQSRIFRLRPR